MNDGELKSLRARRVHETSLIHRIIILVVGTPIWNQCSVINGVCVLLSADPLLLDRDYLM